MGFRVNYGGDGGGCGGEIGGVGTSCAGRSTAWTTTRVAENSGSVVCEVVPKPSHYLVFWLFRLLLWDSEGWWDRSSFYRKQCAKREGRRLTLARDPPMI